MKTGRQDNMMQTIRSSGAIIFYEEGGERKYLIASKQEKPYWGFPKGSGMENESAEETAKREVKEEVGIDAEFMNGFRDVSSYYAAKGVKSIFTLFLAKAKNENVEHADGEIKEHKWLNYSEAMKMLTHKSNREALAKAEEFLKLNVNKT